jgi:hypothetical protein
VKKPAAVLAFALTSFIVTPALVAPADAAADPYTAGVSTSCHLAVPAVVSVGTAPRIRVHVRPNAPAEDAGNAVRPTGSVTVSISKGGTGIFSETVAYNGSPVTIQGSVLNETGRYRVHGTFRTADGSVFKSSRSDTSFAVRANSDGPGEGPGPNPGVSNPGGLLPDTGGPNVVWLLLGLTLVGGGGGLVLAANRRPRGPLYDF